MYLVYEQNNINRIFICCFCLFILNFFTDNAVQAGLKEDEDSLIENIESQHEDEKAFEKAFSSPEEYSPFFSKVS